GISARAFPPAAGGFLSLAEMVSPTVEIGDGTDAAHARNAGTQRFPQRCAVEPRRRYAAFQAGAARGIDARTAVVPVRRPRCGREEYRSLPADGYARCEVGDRRRP